MVVEAFPSRQLREGVLLGPRAGTLRRHARQHPASELPIPANPAMSACNVRGVPSRMIFVQLHVAQQSGSRITSLQKIVAQYPVLGEAVLERALECIDLIDSLTDERAFTEHVLVDIGNGACIGVDARLATVESRVPRPVRAW